MQAAGLDDVLAYLEGLAFTDDELEYLGGTGLFQADFLAFLAGVRFSGGVRAMPEGTLFFPDEPVLEVAGPILEAQLAETMVLNEIHFQSLVAAKAARCVDVAAGRTLVDFSLRRTHRADAGMRVARSSFLAGFDATSNVLAGLEYGIPTAGTMAHSYIESFASEKEAFRTFARDFPGRTTFLVDTYDTLNGVEIAIHVIRELGLSDHLGVRLDSGDLDSLARSARTLLDEAGLTDARIFASGGLDELEVAELVKAGAPVDAFGIGTQMGVSADAPYVDSVYKLTEFDGEPKLKLSSAKATAPGRKQVWRSAAGDLLTLRDEPGPEAAEPLLAPVMRDGRRLAATPALDESRERFRADLAGVPTKARRLTHPEHVVVPHSDALRALTEATRSEAMRRSVGGP